MLLPLQEVALQSIREAQRNLLVGEGEVLEEKKA
jgi:hypothetical protein